MEGPSVEKGPLDNDDPSDEEKSDADEVEETIVDVDIESFFHSSDEEPEDRHRRKTRKRDRSKDEVFTCCDCSKSYFYKISYLKHRSKHTGSMESAILEYKGVPQKIIPKKITRVPKFACGECPKTFPYKGELTRHTLSHIGEKPFPCDLCGSKFSQRSHLNTHKKIHSGIRPFICTTCGKAFTTNSNLVYHMKRHLDIRPFACNECSKSFRTKSDWQRHSQVHTGLKPYRCPDCGSTFTQKSHLNVHIKRHTGEKPIVCAACGKSFWRKNDYEVHFGVHHSNDHHCVECGQKFQKRFSLIKHRKEMHKDPTTDFYKCKICGETFELCSMYKKHVKNHESVEDGSKTGYEGSVGSCFDGVEKVALGEVVRTKGEVKEFDTASMMQLATTA